jgi:hypothetical protein
MAQSTLDTELRSKIDSFLEELSALVKRAALDSVHAALGNGATPTRRGPGRPRGTTRSATAAPASANGKRTSDQVDATAQRIATFVRANPGTRLEQIASGLGTSSKELKLPVIKLLGSKTLTKKGQKRGTKYFVGAGRPQRAQGRRRKA